MQLRNGTVIADGYRSPAPQMWKYVDGQYYGYGSDDQHHAIRYVSVDGKSHRGLSNSGSLWSADAHALRARHHGSVGSPGTGEGNEHAGTHQ